MQEQARLPVTVLTGFLGAGKTTLLNHLISQPHGYKCAIVINEFGPVSIDHRLVIGVDEEITELNNGCLCCRVRGDLIRSLGDLLRKQKRFDYVLIETTGLADPSPIAHTFMASELTGRLRLDGIVTVVDARHIDKELHDAPEAYAQIAFADVILLNKTDLVSPAELEKVEARLRAMNALARVHRTHLSQIDVGKLLNIRARDLMSELSLSPETMAQLPERAQAENHPQHEHEDHEHGEESHDEHAGHRHDEAVRSVYLTDEHPLDLRALESWFSELVKTRGPQIYRAKGFLYLKGQAKRVVFQGVQMMFDARPDRLWNVGEKRSSQLVFIGKDLDEEALRAGFKRCLSA